MNLTTNHINPEISKEIMKYLYETNEVIGNEEYLKDALVSDLLGKHELIQLEEALSYLANEPIDLPKDLRLIESK
jgi:hypothetical protein